MSLIGWVPVPRYTLGLASETVVTLARLVPAILLSFLCILPAAFWMLPSRTAVAQEGVWEGLGSEPGTGIFSPRGVGSLSDRNVVATFSAEALRRGEAPTGLGDYIVLGTKRIKVAEGDNLYTLLRNRGIRPDGSAYSIAKDLNPALRDIDRLQTGQELEIPTLYVLSESIRKYYDYDPSKYQELEPVILTGEQWKYWETVVPKEITANEGEPNSPKFVDYEDFYKNLFHQGGGVPSTGSGIELVGLEANAGAKSQIKAYQIELQSAGSELLTGSTYNFSDPTLRMETYTVLQDITAALSDLRNDVYAPSTHLLAETEVLSKNLIKFKNELSQAGRTITRADVQILEAFSEDFQIKGEAARTGVRDIIEIAINTIDSNGEEVSNLTVWSKSKVFRTDPRINAYEFRTASTPAFGELGVGSYAIWATRGDVAVSADKGIKVRARTTQDEKCPKEVCYDLIVTVDSEPN